MSEEQFQDMAARKASDEFNRKASVQGGDGDGLPPVSYDEHEREMMEVICERDDAEDALSNAYGLVMGEAPEWSNLFGYKEALEAIEARMAELAAPQTVDAPTPKSFDEWWQPQVEAAEVPPSPEEEGFARAAWWAAIASIAGAEFDELGIPCWCAGDENGRHTGDCEARQRRLAQTDRIGIEEYLAMKYRAETAEAQLRVVTEERDHALAELARDDDRMADAVAGEPAVTER